MKIELWPVEKLEAYQRDLKDREKALPKMVDALREWGFRIPLLVSGDGEIIDGKMRYLAAVQLGMTEVPVVVASDLTPTQIRTFRLLVNRSATWAEWDAEALGEELAELRLDLSDLSLTGFSDKELDAFLQGTVASGEKDPGPGRGSALAGRAGVQAGRHLGTWRTQAHVRRLHFYLRHCRAHGRRKGGPGLDRPTL